MAAYSSILSSSSCRVALPPKVSTFPLSLAFSANFIRIDLIPSSRSLMKILNRHGPNIDPWGPHLSQAASLERSYLPPSPGCVWVASSPSTAQTTCLDPNAPINLGGMSEKTYWKPWRQCPLLTPHQLSRSLCCQKVIRLVKHDLPLVNPCWLFLTMCFIWLVIAPRKVCSPTFPGNGAKLTGL